MPHCKRHSGEAAVPAFQAYVCLLQIGGELLHISLAMLVAALFFLLFVWDAIVYENAFELVASSILAVVVAVRVLYFVVSAAAIRGPPCMLLHVLCGLQHAGCTVAVRTNRAPDLCAH